MWEEDGRHLEEVKGGVSGYKYRHSLIHCCNTLTRNLFVFNPVINLCTLGYMPCIPSEIFIICSQATNSNHSTCSEHNIAGLDPCHYCLI